MNNERTQWIESPIFPEWYWVSNKGEVYSVARQKILKPAPDKYGYHYYTLCVNGERKTVKAHRLIAMAFISNPEGKPSVDHIDGNKTNNAADNLRWATNQENSRNPLTLPKLQANSKRNLETMYRLSEARNFGRKEVELLWADGRTERLPSLRIAAEKTGIVASKLSEILNGKRKQKPAVIARWA